MSRKKTNTGTLFTISAYENTMRNKPRYNAYQCGIGAFASEKHPTRAKEKRRWKKEICEQY